VLDRTAGVDFVRAVQITAPDHPEREQRSGPGAAPASIALNDHELVAIDVQPDSFVTMERGGDAWQRAR